MTVAAGFDPATSKQGQDHVHSYVRTLRRLKSKHKQAKQFCRKYKSHSFDTKDALFKELTDGQTEVLKALAKIALPRIPSPHPSPETVAPTAFLQAHYNALRPISPAWHAISWDDDGVTTKPTRMAYNTVADELWRCDMKQWIVHGQLVSDVPGQIGSSPNEWLNSGVFFQIQPYNGRGIKRDSEQCIKTDLEAIVLENDSEFTEILACFTQALSLLPLNFISVASTGGRGDHHIFIAPSSKKPNLKDTLGPILEFLGNDPTGFSACKFSRLPNCGRGGKAKMQTLQWFSLTPTALNSDCQLSSIAEFNDLVFRTAFENRAAVEADQQRMQELLEDLDSSLKVGKAKHPTQDKLKRTRQKEAKTVNDSPTLAERMRLGGKVMTEVRKILANLLTAVPKGEILSLDKVPKTLVRVLAQKFIIGETVAINDREILRCIENVCKTPHLPPGKSTRSQFKSLSKEEFEYPLTFDYTGSTFAPRSQWWKHRVTGGLYTELAWVCRILNSGTAKSKPIKIEVERPDYQLGDRYRFKVKTKKERVGVEATPGEVLKFLKEFVASKPNQMVVLGPKDDPVGRIITSAKKIFKEPKNQPSPEPGESRVENFEANLRQAGATDADLDALLSEVFLRLDAVQFDRWDWIAEDLQRLSDKYWDYENLSKCSSWIKAMIREVVEAITAERSKKLHRSPFIAAEDIYALLQASNKLEPLLSTIPGLNETQAQKDARLKNGVLTKLRRGLREMPDLVTQTRSKSKNANFRVVKLGSNNSNRSICKTEKVNRPTYIASDIKGGPLVLDNQIKKPSKTETAIPQTNKPVATDLGLSVKNIKKPARTKNLAGKATYTLKVDTATGEILLGKANRGKNSHSNVNGFKQKTVNAIFKAEEIPVIVKTIKDAKYGKVLVSGLVSLDAETALKVPATDLTEGNGGTNYLYVEFFIKPPKGMKVDNEADLRLETDAELKVLQVFGHKVSPQAGKAAYCFMKCTVENIESTEAGTMLANWDFETAQKLWKFKDWQAKKAKKSLVTA